MKPTFSAKYYREIPNMRPAILRYFIYGDKPNDSTDFKATILDLINRDYIAICKEGDNYIIKKTEKEKDELCKYEKMLIEVLFEKIAGKDIINSQEFKELIKKDSIIGYRLEAWKHLVKAETYTGDREYRFENKNKERHNKRVWTLIVLLICVEVILLILSFNYEIYEIFYILHITIFSILFSIRGIDEISLCQDTIDDIEKGKALKR